MKNRSHKLAPMGVSQQVESRLVVFTCNSAWGLYQFRRGIISELLRLGVRVYTVAPADECTPHLQAMGCHTIDLSLSPKGVNPLPDLKFCMTLYSLYRRIKPDFVFHYTVKPNIYGALAASAAGVPSISFTTGLGYAFISETWISKMVRALYRVALRFPREVWFLNSEDKDEFLRCRLIKEHQAKLMPGEGVDTRHFAPRMRRAAEEGSFRFLMIGRLLRDKGVDEYVEAAKTIRSETENVSFSLMGAPAVQNPSAVSSDDLNKWIEEGAIDYLGVSNDVRTAIDLADCVVLPSYREGVPRVLLEAAAMGKPIIATDVPGCRDVVIDGHNGFLCSPKSTSSLVDAMRRLLNISSAEREAMGRAGREFVLMNFDEKIVIKRYTETLIAHKVLPNEEEMSDIDCSLLLHD